MGSRGLGGAVHTSGHRVGVCARSSVLNVPSGHTTQSVAVWPGRIPTQRPHCADPGSQQLSWAREAVGADSSLSGSCSDFLGRAPGRPRPAPCVWGPGSVPGLGGQGHSTQSCRGGRAETRLQRLPPCPALSRSCARPYVRHPAAAGAAFPDGPSSLLTTGLGLAGSWAGQREAVGSSS